METSVPRGKIADALPKIGLPDKYSSLLWDGRVGETAATEALKKAATILVLSGGAGVGKTTAAAKWLYDAFAALESWKVPRYRGGPLEWDYAELKVTCRFITAAKLPRIDRYCDKAMRPLLEATRLVVDDLGVEYLDGRGALLSLIDEILNERYANYRATVITTNLTVDEFKGRYGARIADRLREAGRFVSLGDQSLRGKPMPSPPAPSAPEPDRRLPREAEGDEERPAS